MSSSFVTHSASKESATRPWQGICRTGDGRPYSRNSRQRAAGYIRGDLQIALTRLIDDLVDGCHVVPDEDDIDGQTLFVEYPTLYPSGDIAYVAPRVRIEAGARSALDPSLNCTITPYVADELPDWSFDVGDIRVIAPERTYWEKLLILHGVHCGYRNAERLPADRDRISRHYYDVAMITATEIGRSALSDIDLLDAVRNHNLIAFRQAWKRFDEAGSWIGEIGSAAGPAYGD